MLSHLDDGKTAAELPVDPLLPQEVGPDEDDGDPPAALPVPRRAQGRGRRAKGRRPGAAAATSRNKGEDRKSSQAFEQGNADGKTKEQCERRSLRYTFLDPTCEEFAVLCRSMKRDSCHLFTFRNPGNRPSSQFFLHLKKKLLFFSFFFLFFFITTLHFINTASSCVCNTQVTTASCTFCRGGQMSF